MSIIDGHLTRKKSRILDLGCGVGTVSFYLASTGNNVVGIDISKTAINLASRNSKLLFRKKLTDFKRGDFLKMDIGFKFDIVLISEVLEHLENDKEAVKKVYNLCRKGGLVVASSPSKDAPLYRFGLLRSFDKQVGHLRRYTPHEFIDLFKINGFEIVEVRLTEGIIRNFLFTNKLLDKLIRFIKGPLSDIVTFLDRLTIPLLGESQIFVVCRKK